FSQAKAAELALPFPGTFYTLPRRSFYKHGVAFYWAGYPDQAIPYLEGTLRRSPDNVKVLLALGHLHYEAERWKSALDSYQKALALRPDQAAGLLGAGE